MYWTHRFCRIVNWTYSRSLYFIEAWSPGSGPRSGVKPNARAGDGTTALHFVARSGDDPGLVHALVDAGADLRIREDDEHQSPICLAARYSEYPPVLSALLERGADANDWCSMNERFRHGVFSPVSPLHLSAAYNPLPRISEILLEAGADPNATGGSVAETPLDSWGLHQNNDGVKEVLLRYGARHRTWCLAPDYQNCPPRPGG